MPVGITLATTTALATSQKIMIASAREAYEPAAPDPDLIESTRIPRGTKTWEMIYYARLAVAAALTEGVDLAAPEQLSATSVSVTPTEVGIIVTLTNRLVRRQSENVMSVAGRQMGGSLRRRLSTDIITLYDSFTKSIVGAGSPLDITYFRGGVAYLLTDNSAQYGPATMPLRAALHIEQISDIILDITDPGTSVGRFAGEFSTEMVKRWWRGNDRVYGIEMFHAGNIARDAGDDAKGAIFNPSSMHLVYANEVEVTEQPDHSLRAVEHGMFQEKAESIIANPHGIEVFSDAIATV